MKATNPQLRRMNYLNNQQFIKIVADSFYVNQLINLSTNFLISNLQSTSLQLMFAASVAQFS